MPSDLVFKSLNHFHRALLKATGGRVGWVAGGMPVLELTTIGRRSGQPRTTILTSPLRDGADIVIVASRGGDDHHPAWYLNLQSNADVTVRTNGQPPRKMRATIADTTERARLWQLLNEQHDNYAGYQRKTQREIPVVVLRAVEA